VKNFELCRKGEIQQDSIDIELVLKLDIQDDPTFDDDEDYDLLHRCQSLDINIEIGESYERDKFRAFERHRLDRKKNTVFGSRSHPFSFPFKMNHIKQTIRLEVSGQFTSVKPDQDVENRTICKCLLCVIFRRGILQFRPLCAQEWPDVPATASCSTTALESKRRDQHK
jgi:hypothetical protein